MGKRNVDHDLHFDTPTNKKRKLDTSNSSDASPVAPNSDVAFLLSTDIVDGVILTDLCGKKWRCGKPIGKGSFGEIFLASDDTMHPVTDDNAKYVVKIEPHKSGPLFVEIHCLMKAGKDTEEKPLPLGMPTYIASGGHNFGQSRYRFLILPRFDFDLHSIIKSRRMETKNILIIADQLLDIMEHLHDNGYAHSDIKAENIMVTKCVYDKNKYAKSVAATPQKPSSRRTVPATVVKKATTTITSSTAQNGKSKRQVVTKKYNAKRSIYRSGSSSKENSVKDSDSDDDDDDEYEMGEDDDEDEDDDDDDDDDDEGDEEEEEEEGDDEDDENDSEEEIIEVNEPEVNENETDSDSDYDMVDRHDDKDFTPTIGKRAAKHIGEFGGSNPVRSCRMENKTQMYDDMVTSHYLRRSTKRVNYCEDEGDEEKPVAAENDDDDDWVAKNRYISKLFSSKAVYEPKENKATKSTGGMSHYQAADSDDVLQKPEVELITEDRVYLIDFGLALKFVDSNGTHRPFIMDQRRAHDGTLEFTSRDAHMGAHSRRSDLECLAYNLIYWKEGFLPWKSDKLMNQPEQVHRMKEFFMTDVKQLYKKTYGVSIPTFIYEFMTHVSNLAYHERPNYKLCKQILMKEFVKLGYKKKQMVLSIDDLKVIPTRDRDEEETENAIIEQKLQDFAKMMKFGMIIPFCETPVNQNQISPKNLRSKSVKNPKKKRKKFSWTEILSTDPDQIARQRAEKEFERDQGGDETPSRRYSGKPTYAILEVENNKSKQKQHVDTKDQDTHNSTDNYIKGYTKPMMDVWRKRQLNLMKQFQINNNNNHHHQHHHNNSNSKESNVRHNNHNHNSYSNKHNNQHSSDTTTTTATTTATVTYSRSKKKGTVTNNSSYHRSTNNGSENSHMVNSSSTNSNNNFKGLLNNSSHNNNSSTLVTTPVTTNKSNKQQQKRKPGLRRVVMPTKKIVNYRNNIIRRRKHSSKNNSGFHPIDDEALVSNAESSDGGSHSSASDASDISHTAHCITDLNRNTTSRKYNSSGGTSSPVSEDDSRETTEFSPIQTRHARVRKTSAMKSMAISDEDSRDTTDYSPVKSRYKSKSKDGRSKRKRQEKKTKRQGKVYGKKVPSQIRAISRG